MEYIMNKYARDIRLVHKNEIMKFDMDNKFENPEMTLTKLINFCMEIIQNVIKSE